MQSAEPDGYFKAPSSGEGRQVLVLHAWWGLNDTIKAFCDRLAACGFVTFAPDLYHGKIAKTLPEAEALGKAVDDNDLQAQAEVLDAAKFLSDRAGQSGQGLAVIGFSLGAYYALELAAAEPEKVRSVVLFYGTGPVDLNQSKASFLGHYAEHDEYEPKDQADRMEAYLREIGRPVTFHTYPDTGHWFFEPDRTREYNKEAADLAWDRTLAFLKNLSTS